MAEMTEIDRTILAYLVTFGRLQGLEQRLDQVREALRQVADVVCEAVRRRQFPAPEDLPRWPGADELARLISESCQEHNALEALWQRIPGDRRPGLVPPGRDH
jgi:hypothetical protein